MIYTLTRYESEGYDYEVEADSPEEAEERVRRWESEYFTREPDNGESWGTTDPVRVLVEHVDDPEEREWLYPGQIGSEWKPVTREGPLRPALVCGADRFETKDELERAMKEHVENTWGLYGAPVQDDNGVTLNGGEFVVAATGQRYRWGIKLKLTPVPEGE